MIHKARRHVRDQVHFLGALVEKPRSTGAIAPSSPALAEEMVAGLDLPHAGMVVEFGPGTGSITRAIERHARPDATIALLEIHEGFVARLREQFPRFQVIHDSAENLQQHLQAMGRDGADCIVSGLPFAAFPQALQESLLQAAHAGLRPGGRFATFTYIHARHLPLGRRFYERLCGRFGEVETSRVVWRNLPPAVVYRCRK